MAEPAAKLDEQASSGHLPDDAARGYSVHGIHTLRTLQLSTLTLSQMADQKASMLMGASFVVFSLAVGRSLSGEVPWPLAVLALFAFFSSLCAAIAVMPSIGKPKQQVGRPNPLFFGHFHDLDEESWTQDILDRLHRDEDLFRLMLHDAYQNGQVLHRRKYRFMRYAYALFIVGLVATLATFVIVLAAG
ncbi:MAG TPA: Pycsar system effector family protein [Croceibacterium sp.]|nr:Pycsar system effector family protein [Croceibacterium sp.]